MTKATGTAADIDSPDTGPVQATSTASVVLSAAVRSISLYIVTIDR